MNLKNNFTGKIFSTVSRIAHETGCEAYAVGGFVRDLLLQRECKDVDIVVTGSGIDFAEKSAEAMGLKKVVVYENFGTALLKTDDLDIEFVGARKESYRGDSRKPEVESGTIEDDRNRRDFTINALSVSLNRQNFGELVDPFNGLDDLEKKIIRTPLNPDITFSDDPLRMMRAIRFAAQLEFTIERTTFQAIIKNRERINIVSKERISDELNKIVLSSHPSSGFRLLMDTGLLHIFFQQLAALKGVEEIEGKGHKDNFYHTLKVLDNVAAVSDDLWLRWAALLHDIAKPLTKKFDPVEGWTFHNHEFRGAKMVKHIFRQLRLPLNEKMRYVEKLVLLHLRPIVLASEEVTDSAVRRLLTDAGDDVDDLMILCQADITSKNEIKVNRYIRNLKIVKEKLKEVEEKDRLRNFQPPISGELIMQTFNLQPCKTVGIIKEAIREAILDGTIHNEYEEAYGFMLKKGGELGLKARN
ncbi:MAG: HD domain-containing protein [Bacteroidetes bacterium]|nr:HD domain-containing protein [Bacteroidota bacterium]